MNDDKAIISLLIENGAYLDYRASDKNTWKTPLHIAAYNNKPQSLQVI